MSVRKKVLYDAILLLYSHYADWQRVTRYYPANNFYSTVTITATATATGYTTDCDLLRMDRVNTVSVASVAAYQHGRACTVQHDVTDNIRNTQ